MVYNLLTLPVTLIFIVNGFGHLFYAINLKKKYLKEHNNYNNIIMVFLWIVAGLCYPLFYTIDNIYIRWFQSLSLFFICIFTPCLIFLILFYQYQFVIRKRNPQIMEIRDFKVFLENFQKKTKEEHNLKKIKLKTDLRRKCLHLFPAGVIIILWIFAVYVWEGLWNADEIWGINGEQFGKFLILTAGYSGLLIFAALDYVRLSFIFEKRNLFHLIPDNVRKLLSKSMKRDEVFQFIRPSTLVLAFVPTFFFPFSVFAACILIATIGDGAASIFGLKFGRFHFPKSSEKTIIGYVAGFLTSFIISLMVMRIFEPTFLFYKIIFIALSGASVFLAIDLLNLDIDDNILNPIFSSLIMVLLYYVL